MDANKLVASQRSPHSQSYRLHVKDAQISEDGTLKIFS